MNARPMAAVFCAALCAFLAAPTRASGEGGGPSSIRWVEGARAPVDAWLQDDGCSARTGATETQAFTGPREVAWKFEVKGEIEGEPLAWRGKTFVVEKAAGKRTLHVLSTETGAVGATRTFETSLPLAPVVGEGRVLLRSSPRTLQGFTITEKTLTPRWTATAKAAIGPPTALKDEVYVVMDGGLVRFAYGAPSPAWKATDLRVDGPPPPAGGKGVYPELPRPSVRGSSVYLATGTKLYEVGRDDGRIVRTGALPGAVDPAARVVVGLADVLVPVGAEHVRLSGEGTAFTAGAPLKLPAGVVAMGREFIGLFAEPEGTILGQLGAADRGIDEGGTLGNKDVHGEYLGVRTAPTASVDVAIVGGRMFDAGSREVLNASPIAGISRVIPIADRLLVVDTRNRVVAHRPARKPAAIPPLLPTGKDAEALPPSHAVVEDGRVVAGPFTFDAKAGILRGGSGKTAESWPVASVRALVTDEAPTRLLLCARPRDAAWAVTAAARVTAASRLIGLTAKAVTAKDAMLARRMLTAATERGAAEADVQKQEKVVAALEAAGGGGDRDDAAVSQVEDDFKEITTREADALLEAASSIPEGAPDVYATSLVRSIIARSPYHPGATAWVRAHLPPGLSPPGFKDLADWLDFLEVRATANVRIFGPNEKVPDDVAQDVVEALEEARKEWRPDLVGFLNGSLLVVSPPEHPAAIATCLSLGRIVSDTLDAAFASVGPRRTDESVLVLQLFPNKAQYLAAGSKGRSSFGHLEHSAGHYSPRDNVTRIFWPSGGDGDSVPGVYCHELTHHWVGVRRPKRSGVDDPPDASGGPGYWICEGIADFMKDHAYDLAAGKAEAYNPQAHYADAIAGVAEKDLFPWASFLTMTQAEAYGQDKSKEIKGRLRHRMGLTARYDPVNLWYAQSASTTAFLYLAENGKYRTALMTFLYDHYAGVASDEALLTTIGLTAEELGAKIVAWCKALGAPPPAK